MNKKIINIDFVSTSCNNPKHSMQLEINVSKYKCIPISKNNALLFTINALNSNYYFDHLKTTLTTIKCKKSLKKIWRTAAKQKSLNKDIQELFRSEWTIRSHQIRNAFNNDKELVKILYKIFPAYTGSGMTLWRGEQLCRFKKNRVGFNWTPKEEVAKRFASGLCSYYKEGGVLLKVYAEPQAIITGSCPHSEYLGEYELIVNPFKLSKITEIKHFNSR